MECIKRGRVVNTLCTACSIYPSSLLSSSISISKMGSELDTEYALDLQFLDMDSIQNNGLSVSADETLTINPNMIHNATDGLLLAEGSSISSSSSRALPCQQTDATKQDTKFGIHLGTHSSITAFYTPDYTSPPNIWDPNLLQQRYVRLLTLLLACTNTEVATSCPNSRASQ